jgi:hypothetical protein
MISTSSTIIHHHLGGDVEFTFIHPYVFRAHYSTTMAWPFLTHHDVPECNGFP